MTLAELARQYQDLLEAQRALGNNDPHDLADEVETMVAEARAHLETAWLTNALTNTTNSTGGGV